MGQALSTLLITLLLASGLASTSHAKSFMYQEDAAAYPCIRSKGGSGILTAGSFAQFQQCITDATAINIPMLLTQYSEPVAGVPAGNQVVWAIDDTVVVSVPIIMPPASMLTVAAGKVLTMATCPYAGDYQIFVADGVTTGTVSFVDCIHPNAAWWGAVPNDSEDDTLAFQAAITAARTSAFTLETIRGATAVIAPYGQYDVSDTLVLATKTLTPVNLICAQAAAWVTAFAECALVANMDKPLLSMNDATNTVGATGSLIQGWTLVNKSTGASSCVVYLNHVGGPRIVDTHIAAGNQGIGCNGGEIISSEFRNVTIYSYGANPAGGCAAYSGFFRNVHIAFGRIFAFDYAFNISGNSWNVINMDMEFNRVILRHTALDSWTCIDCHIEESQLLLTNAATVPLLRTATNWTDAGGEGTGIAGSINFIGGSYFFPATMYTNLIVLKSQASFVYNINILGGSWLGQRLQIGSSFTPGATTTYPVGTTLNIQGRAADNLTLHEPAIDNFTRRFLFGNIGMHTDRAFVDEIYAGDAGASKWFTTTTPGANGAVNLGSTNLRWGSIFSVNEPDFTSDARLKTDIVDESVGLNFVLGLKPKQFRWIDGDGRINHGFLAQDLEAQLGTQHAIITPPASPDDYYGMKATQLIPILTRAIQELEARTRALEGAAR